VPKGRFSVKTFLPQRVNAQISQHYDIDPREIGSGGHGKVFVARDRNMTGRLVAIKKIICQDEEKREAFRNEVLVMKELDHPNICKVLETYDDGRFMFLVMEYLEGGELFDRIMDEGMLEESITADIIWQVASALSHAHSRGIAHRDMKAENICFCTPDAEDNQVKVIDWGLGFYFGLGRMKSSVGSLTYAAPEVLEAEDEMYTSACDLWSLGVLAYVMLCGMPPFAGSYMEQVRRMRKEEYDLSKSVWPSVSDDAKDLIRGLLKCEPQERLPLHRILVHPWLRNKRLGMDAAIGSAVLSNVRNFSNSSQFFSFCVALVARQLDHRSLRDVHRVFCEMDTNGDGVLELQEVKEGFERIFGADSEQVRGVEEMFTRLDLDGSGTIDYTEFCAAGIGERLSTEENVLWAAFKAFDIQDNEDGKVTKSEIRQVLLKADVNRFLTDQICDELSDELFSRYDGDGDGSLDFEEWLRLMRDISTKHREDAQPTGQARTDSEQQMREIEQERQSGALFDKAYSLLTEDKDKAGEASAFGSEHVSVSESTTQLARREASKSTCPSCFAGGSSKCFIM